MIAAYYLMYRFDLEKNLTEEANYELNNKMVSALNNESVQGGTLHDLTNVLDCLNHNISQSNLNFNLKTSKVNE